MNTLVFDPLVDVLREELAGYGALLALFEKQQGQLWRREIDAVAASSQEIERLAAESGRLRVTRELWVRDLAETHARPADSSLRQLLDIFPADQRPLLQALIDEINLLIHRVRRHARQNQIILRRAMELHHESLALLQPAPRPRTYSGRGKVAAPVLAGATALRAAV